MKDARQAPQVVFFDAAGTLFQLRESVGQGYARVAERFGWRTDPAALDRRFREFFRAQAAPEYAAGSTLEEREEVDREWWRVLVAEVMGVKIADTAEFPEFFGELFEHFGQASCWRLYPETLEVLQACRPRRLFVLSNFDRRLQGILEGLGIADCFEEAFFSTALAACKPSRLAFETALRLAKVSADDALHVGDDPEADWRGASEAGVPHFPLDRSIHSLSHCLRLVFPRST